MAGPRKKKPKADDHDAPHPPKGGHHHAPTHAPSHAAGRGTAGPLLGVAAKTAVAASLIVCVVYLIVRAGETAGAKVAPRDRYTIAFTELTVEPPPGLDRLTFLSEAQHLGDGPPTLQAVDPNLSATLTAVFAKHPWVAEVAGVSVSPDAAVTVTLKYRVPVLAVTLPGTADPRTVDRAGVLLPHLPPPRPDLPLLLTPRPAPTTAEGQPWPDEVVRRAAVLAVDYKPKTIEKLDRGWRLTRPDGTRLVVSF